MESLEIPNEPGSSSNRLPAPLSLKIATYNINCANGRLEAVVETIRKADADVICLQETNAQSADVLRREFAQRYSFIRFYGSVRPYAAGGFGVLSRRPITDERFLPAQHGLFGACDLRIRTAGGQFQLLVVHLQPVLIKTERGAGNILGVLAAFDQAEQIHREEITEILKHVDPGVHVVLAGDFNSASTSQAPALLLQEGFVDSFASVHAAPEDHPTWRWPTKIGEARLRIDYIFHTPSLSTVDSQVIKAEGSDHYLVVSHLRSASLANSAAATGGASREAAASPKR